MWFVYLLCGAIYRLTFAFVKRRAGPLKVNCLSNWMKADIIIYNPAANVRNFGLKFYMFKHVSKMNLCLDCHHFHISLTILLDFNIQIRFSKYVLQIWDLWFYLATPHYNSRTSLAHRDSYVPRCNLRSLWSSGRVPFPFLSKVSTTRMHASERHAHPHASARDLK